MKNRGALSLGFALAAVASVACGGREPETPTPAYAAPPVAITSAPPPVPPPPSGISQGPQPGIPLHGGGEGASHEAARRDHGRVYKLDFVLTAKEGGTASPATSFTLILEEGRSGDIHIGKNVALAQATAPTGAGPAAFATPRQDVGLKVRAHYQLVGEDLLLDVTTEMSTQESPSTIRKIAAVGNALATAGKPSLVVAVDEDKKHYELTVTPTKLR
jgi:hypothetical protein